MASPATGDADAAERFFEDVTNFTRFGSDVVNNDGHSSIPPSPELGMAREGGGYISDAEWSLSEEDGAESQQHGGPARSIENHGHDSASKADNGDARVKGSLVRRTQRSLPESAQRASPEHMDAQRTTPAPTCPPIRRSTRIKSTLVYDQKYHPLDDIIRPSQAAKRRSLHGEESTRPNYSDGSASEDSGFDVGSGDENSGDEESRPSTRGHKRRRLMSQAPEPTRRSSRRRTKPNVSYNMKIHPQDSDLRRGGACDGSKSSLSPTKHRRSSRNSPAEKDRSASGFEDACPPMVVGGSSESTLQPSPELSPSRGSTPEPPAKPTQQLFDEQPELRPDVAYLTTNQHAWPDVNGLPFHIFTERIQDQLNKEAEAASPFHYDDDDKENDVTNPELVPAPNSLDGISIIPASQHRHALELHTYQGYNTIANNAFHMQPRLETLPYGLGWSDGVHNIHISDNRNHPMPDYMRILTSGENLPQTPTPADTCSDSREPAANSSPTRTLEGLELLR